MYRRTGGAVSDGDEAEAAAASLRVTVTVVVTAGDDAVAADVAEDCRSAEAATTVQNHTQTSQTSVQTVCHIRRHDVQQRH